MADVNLGPIGSTPSFASQSTKNIKNVRFPSTNQPSSAYYDPSSVTNINATYTSPNLLNPDLTGQGEAGKSVLFDQLMQLVTSGRAGAQQAMSSAETAVKNLPPGASTLASRTARYGPGALAAAQQFQTDPLAGAATLGATAIAGKAIQGLSAAIPNPLARGAVQLAGGLLAAPIASQLGKGVSTLGNQLIGGAQAAVNDATGAVAGAQREAGQSAGTGVEAGVASDKATQQAYEKARLMGVNLPNQYLTTNYQILQKYKEADKTRVMQLNQQNAVLTGQLNQQIIAGQLAAGAQSEAGATTRQILASNPYAASVLQTGGVRGI